MSIDLKSFLQVKEAAKAFDTYVSKPFATWMANKVYEGSAKDYLQRIIKGASSQSLQASLNYDIKAHTFNVATITIVATTALAVFGLMNVATAAVVIGLSLYVRVVAETAIDPGTGNKFATAILYQLGITSFKPDYISFGNFSLIKMPMVNLITEVDTCVRAFFA